MKIPSTRILALFFGFYAASCSAQGIDERTMYKGPATPPFPSFLGAFPGQGDVYIVRVHSVGSLGENSVHQVVAPVELDVMSTLDGPPLSQIHSLYFPPKGQAAFSIWPDLSNEKAGQLFLCVLRPDLQSVDLPPAYSGKVTDFSPIENADDPLVGDMKRILELRNLRDIKKKQDVIGKWLNSTASPNVADYILFDVCNSIAKQNPEWTLDILKRYVEDRAMHGLGGSFPSRQQEIADFLSRTATNVANDRPMRVGALRLLAIWSSENPERSSVNAAIALASVVSTVPLPASEVLTFKQRERLVYAHTPFRNVPQYGKTASAIIEWARK
jgi:hypothetical protein